MKKPILIAMTGGVWVAAIGSAAVLAYALNRPLVLRDVANSRPARGRYVAESRTAVDETRCASTAVEMPAMVVVGRLAPTGRRPSAQARGVAEMQGHDEAIIGSGFVTHMPEENSRIGGAAQAKRARTRRQGSEESRPAGR